MKAVASHNRHKLASCGSVAWFTVVTEVDFKLEVTERIVCPKLPRPFLIKCISVKCKFQYIYIYNSPEYNGRDSICAGICSSYRRVWGYLSSWCI